MDERKEMITAITNLEATVRRQKVEIKRLESLREGDTKGFLSLMALLPNKHLHTIMTNIDKALKG